MISAFLVMRAPAAREPRQVGRASLTIPAEHRVDLRSRSHWALVRP